MAKVKYYAKENSSIGTHSFYAVPIKEGLTEKKHKIEKIEKGLATLDDIFSILTN